MPDTERVRRLKAMLEQVKPGPTIESVRPARIPTEALESMPGAFAEAAPDIVDTAVSKVAEHREEDLTHDEVFALEAIVLPQNRPVVFVRGDAYDAVTDPWLHLNDDATKKRIAPLLRSIGRIELPHTSWIPYGGTGFVVGKDLLMTNRHVAALFSQGLGESKLRFTSGDAAINFRRQVDSAATDASAQFTVVGVEMVHPYWDMALLRVEGLTDVFPALSLAITKPEDLVDRDVVAVGYPARDDRSDLALQDRIFEKTYNVKRLQPGKIRPRGRIRSFENDVDAMTHDSSTLGGNSGSAIVDVQTGQVVGLHFAGIYLKANYAVPTYELARDAHVTKRNLNFAGSVAPTTDWEPVWQSVSGAEAARTPAGANVQNPSPTPTPPPTPTPIVVASGGATWTIPLQVSVSIGTPVRAGAEIVAIAGVEAPHMALPVIFDGLENRTGYNGGFLDLEDDEDVPLPRLTSVGKSVAAKLEDGSTELKYHKFSLVMHKGRRLALFTAANVDWRPPMRAPGGSKPSRKELTGLADGTQEMWATDWRIAPEHQLPDVFYTKDGGAFDKGHLVRRDDVCWGKTFKDIQKANGDTFHTTNCSPQTKQFNQSAQGVDNWGDLENLVQKETKAEKAILFSGPVLEEDDPLFEGRDDNGKINVRIPRTFWKIVVVKGEDGPEAYGFVLEQDLSAIEFAVPSQWRKYLRPIADIEEMLHGLVEIPWLKKHDHMESDEGVRIRESLR